MTRQSTISLLSDIAARCVVLPPRHGSDGTQEYVRRGLPIPEALLPGKFVEGLPRHEREELREMVSDGPRRGEWFVQFIIG